MMWLLLFIVILGYLIAMHKEIIMYFKLLWEKYIIDINPVISYFKKEPSVSKQLQKGMKKQIEAEEKENKKK